MTPGLMVACGTSYSLDVTDPSTWKFSALRFWLSHDGGATWQALRPPLLDDKQCAVAFRIDGGIYASQGDYPQLLDTGLVSYDDGQTWRREPPPAMDGRAPVLEHSADDGEHWMAVGPISSGRTEGVALAVNAAQPGHICAAYYGETNHADLLASLDGGITWRVGIMPSGYDDTSGESWYNPQMDAQEPAITAIASGGALRKAREGLIHSMFSSASRRNRTRCNHCQ
jgi:hypothetical protein